MFRKSSISLDDIWHHLLDGINVPVAHLGYPELPDAFLQLRHALGLCLSLRKFFIEPQTFKWGSNLGYLLGSSTN